MIKIKIKQNLSEATIQEFTNLGAIFTQSRGHNVIVLIDKNSLNISDPIKNIIGSIKFASAISQFKKNCNNAYNITSSLVYRNYKNKGYGKLLYKLAAASVNLPIMPDRNDTSRDAQRVWKSFNNKSEGFKKTKVKDCFLVDDDSAPYLDYSYKLNDSEVTKYKNILNEITSGLQLDDTTVQKILNSVSANF